MRFRFLFILLLLLPTVKALEWNAQFHIIGDSVVVDYGIANVSSPFILDLPFDSRAIEVGGKMANKTFLIENDTNVTYIFSSALQRTDKGFFLFDFVAPIDIDRLKISVWLPEGAWLEAGYPKSYVTITEGQHIIVVWNTFLEKNNSMPIFVIFKSPGFPITIAILAFIFAFAIFGVFLLKRRKKAKLYLLEDERKIVELLSAAPNKTMKQKELWKATGWSKAKLSRTIRRLQERGLIEVRPYGNTNLIILKF
jgi:hypothetical protein